MYVKYLALLSVMSSILGYWYTQKVALDKLRNEAVAHESAIVAYKEVIKTTSFEVANKERKGVTSEEISIIISDNGTIVDGNYSL